MKFPTLKNSERGQALLIVVLIMVVSLTIGLSVAGRSITNLRTSVDEQNSERAFSAAEAGIEQILKNGAEINNYPLPNGSVINKTKIDPVSGTEFILNSGNSIEKDDGQNIWLIDHSLTGTPNYNSGWQLFAGDAFLTVYWGPQLASQDVCDPRPAFNTSAALEITVVSGTPSDPFTTRYAIDPCSARQTSNHFSSVDSVPPGPYTVSGKQFAYRKEIQISVLSKGLLVHVTPLYASTSIAAKGCQQTSAICNSLPSQGRLIQSIGEAGSTQRKISVFQAYSECPAEFCQNILFVPKGS